MCVLARVSAFVQAHVHTDTLGVMHMQGNVAAATPAEAPTPITPEARRAALRTASAALGLGTLLACSGAAACVAWTRWYPFPCALYLSACARVFRRALSLSLCPPVPLRPSVHLSLNPKP